MTQLCLHPASASIDIIAVMARVHAAYLRMPDGCIP